MNVWTNDDKWTLTWLQLPVCLGSDVPLPSLQSHSELHTMRDWPVHVCHEPLCLPSSTTQMLTNSKIQLRETNIPPPRVPAPAPVCPGPLIPVIPVSHSKLQGTSLHRSYILTCLQRANGMPWAIQRSPLELVDLILWTLRWRDFALICKWHAMATGKHPQALVTKCH